MVQKKNLVNVLFEKATGTVIWKKDRLITKELKNETKIKIQFNLVLFKDNI